MDITAYQDIYGFLHNCRNPRPDQTENPMVFTGTYFLLKDKEIGDDHELARLHGLLFQHDKASGKWQVRPTAVSAWGTRPSHDDVTAWLSALKRYGMDWEIEQYPISWRHKIRVWDWLYYRALKNAQGDRYHSVAKLPWLTRQVGRLSCKQGHKRRPWPFGKKIAKTDGKILALCRALACNDQEEVAHLTKLIAFTEHGVPLPQNAQKIHVHKVCVSSFLDCYDKSWQWVNWQNIFLDYFQNDPGYPNVVHASRL